MRWLQKKFGCYHLDVSKSLILQKKVYWWGVRWQKGMQSKDINQKFTEHDAFLIFATQAQTGLGTLDENWSSFCIQYLEHCIKISIDCGALSWQHYHTSMECSDQCSQGSDCCAQVVTAFPVCPVPQGQACRGYLSTQQTLMAAGTSMEQDSKKQKDFIAIKNANLYKPTF